MRRMMNVFGLACTIVFITMTSTAYAGETGKIQGYIDIIRKGPKMYRTPAAMQTYTRFNPYASADAGVSSLDDMNAMVQSLRAVIALGDIGPDARAAIPVLVEMFPQAEDVSINVNVQYNSSAGSFDDWVSTDILGARNKFMLKSTFLDYQTLSRLEKWIECKATSDIHDKRMSGSKMVFALADIYFTLRLSAGAYALEKIAGVDNGNSKEAWQKWYQQQNAATTQSSSSTSAPVIVRTTTVSAFPQVDYAQGSRYQIELTTGDKIIGTIEAADDNSVTIKQDGSGRFNYPRSFIKSSIALSPSPAVSTQNYSTTPASVYTGGIAYESLLDFSYSGKYMQVTMKNGSVFKGNLGVVDATILHLTVDGTEISISRNVILSISLLEDPNLPKAVPATQPQTQTQESVQPTGQQVPAKSSGTDSSPW